ncbi:hypothetical protein [Shewanella psychrotolerans]|uniref:hypothetical protein n=1 Tax=Shewanella psychrotolerans TaxID=2864206 RepID=UPI001C661D86|nr:hypothetical protein [Shewanella psychrotolerans]QYJ99950.1 hypothetical protein K0I62_10860 [Shewanella psychrotolerans]
MPIRITLGDNGRKLCYNMVEPSFSRTFSSYQDDSVLVNHINDRRLVDNTKRPVSTTIYLIFAVVLAHLLLLWCLQIAWKPSLHSTDIKQSSAKDKKVNAYIIYQPATSLTLDSIAPTSAKVQPNVIEQSTSPAAQVDLQTAILTTDNNVNQADNQLKNGVSENNKPRLQDKKTSSQNHKVNNTVTQTSAGTVNVSLFTQGYVEKQRLIALDSLVATEANLYTQNRSLSEMDGDIEILQLSSPDEFTVAGTLDSHIDPNRIVKQGDTCYRIVKVGTVLNPHAENLGYPFKCGGQTIQQALKAALDKRLAIMGVKN